MSGISELRETIVVMQRELKLLRTEARHASTLIKALDSLLVVTEEDDPFSDIFSALLPVFNATHAIVLVQSDGADDALQCVASSHADLIGTNWRADRLIAKILGGRSTPTLSSSELGACLLSATLPFSGACPTLYLPLRVRQRRGLLILLRNPGDKDFDRSHVTLARKFSPLASHALAARYAHHSEADSQRLTQLTNQLTESQSALAYRANHDQLTGLPNRARIQELVDGLLARKKPGGKLALAFINLDDFKRVNDLYGHATGDALLCSVASRIRSKIRSTDIVGRINGDEFVVVLNPFERRKEIAAIIGRIRDILQQPFDIEGIQLKGTGSIGVAFYPTHGQSFDVLRRNADAAMYRAKTSEKGGIEFFSHALGKLMSEKLQLEQRLRDAFDKRQFKSVLQGKFTMAERRIVGFEILLRWIDEHGTVHAPGTFLASASELGLLDGIVIMQIEELLSRLPQLNETFGRDIIYSINISANQATRPAFMKAVIRHISASGRAGNFMLELTEESFLKADAFGEQILPLIRAAGIRISIDDFGTGYSSLSLLAEITADELKIDRSFISSIHERSRNQSILRAIESLSKAFGIPLIAEGIETEMELAYLRCQTDIQFGQGFLFHKPAFIEDLLSSDGAQLLQLPAQTAR